jgi:superfamily II DNA/RNA helicase
VLDETDRMLDMGFAIQLDAIAKYLPPRRQTLMFSATMPDNIIKLSNKYLHSPERIAVGSTTATAVNIKQEEVFVSQAGKYAELLKQLDQREGSVIVFVRTKHGADRLADKLSRQNHSADAIHGDLQQRQRDRVIAAFRNKQHRIMVATDIAARGLDIPHIEHVINYDLPQCPEDYIHRIGRTARAGAEGSSLCMIAPEDGDKWRAIQRLINPGSAAAQRPQGGNSGRPGGPGGNEGSGKSRRPFRRRGKPSGSQAA